ncbi:ThiF family adenylyltransferase [Rheinheimera sp.]|uniref:ThiF family adenylyltransferase n=1 Tax=Rheinheimera sp. TaxID=1869214 RepID=UPI004047F2B0
MTTAFNYQQAFSRNIGWFTVEEQQKLQQSRIAIAGCGGVGGAHLLSLARLGIGQFSLADFDSFGIENFNRQVGANMSSIGRPKLAVMLEQLLSINPDADIRAFDIGINEHNLAEFMQGVDLYIDSLDFFAISIRRKVFAYCAEHNIPAVTAAPLGMGTAFLCFMPGQMSFEQYFGMEHAASLEEQYLRFYLGLAPAGLQSCYLVDPTTLNLAEKRGPSTIVGCTMGVAMATAYAAKILLGRGPLVCAPQGLHWDPYLNIAEQTDTPGGHLNSEFQRRLAEAKQQFGIN